MEWVSRDGGKQSKYVVPRYAERRCTSHGPHSCPVAWLHASGGISMRAGQFPAQTVAAVSLFSIMAKDKGNLLCFKICNKQPLMMNEAAIKFKTERTVMLLLN